MRKDFVVTAIIMEPSGNNLLGFECKAIEDCKVYRMPGATFEMGLINGVYEEAFYKDEVFIISAIELMMNLSQDDFECLTLDNNGNKVESSLTLPPFDKITTVIPYFKFNSGNIKKIKPYEITDNGVLWTSPAELYEKTFGEMFKFRIENNDLINTCKSVDENTLDIAIYAALRNIIVSDVKRIKNIS